MDGKDSSKEQTEKKEAMILGVLEIPINERLMIVPNQQVEMLQQLAKMNPNPSR